MSFMIYFGRFFFFNVFMNHAACLIPKKIIHINYLVTTICPQKPIPQPQQVPTNNRCKGSARHKNAPTQVGVTD